PSADERRRLMDIYQAGLLDIGGLQQRAKDVDSRRSQLESQRENLIAERQALARDNRLKRRVVAFAERARESLDGLEFEQRQRLLRLVVQEVRVKGWQVEIRLRIPLDDGTGSPSGRRRPLPPEPPVSSEVRMRSLHHDDVGVVEDAVDGGRGQALGHNGVEAGRMQVGSDGQAALLIGGVG